MKEVLKKLWSKIKTPIGNKVVVSIILAIAILIASFCCLITTFVLAVILVAIWLKEIKNKIVSIYRKFTK